MENGNLFVQITSNTIDNFYSRIYSKASRFSSVLSLNGHDAFWQDRRLFLASREKNYEDLDIARGNSTWRFSL